MESLRRLDRPDLVREGLDLLPPHRRDVGVKLRDAGLAPSVSEPVRPFDEAGCQLRRANGRVARHAWRVDKKGCHQPSVK
jgi:hypothetical protein